MVITKAIFPTIRDLEGNLAISIPATKLGFDSEAPGP